MILKSIPLKRSIFLLLIITSTSFFSFATTTAGHTKWADTLGAYRATATRINDLVNTRLDVKFDYAKHFLYGKEWVTLKPHAYATDSLALDAKGMDINEISLISGTHKSALHYTYDQKVLRIKLAVVEKPSESYTIYISYTAKPDLLKSGGSAAISNDKGLYFINSDASDLSKPVQIWTQGETESSSCWFPTIDKPNQKTTDEISMTVPAKYITLSNGRLASQKQNADGSRTDTWKMDLPHAPYLIMMAVGDFKVYHDHWKTIPVDYYLEPKYAPFAKQIFGNTPEMIDFYSKTLGVDYPWNKYAQIVVRDYVSGAMENTTATLHGESVQRTARELLDDNQEDYIAHELFHQWFGDYATCESWSNITCNESFAAFSEIIWSEYKYGKEKADADRLEKLKDYLSTFSRTSPELVRFHYKSREDVFDVVSYNKGAVILYMLRDLLGKETFYKGLHIYLKNNAFKATEAQQLRLAFEDASGQDLNWFFNQWYYTGGHPIISWDQKYNQAGHQLEIKLVQTQDTSNQIYKLPLAVDIYTANGRERKNIIMNRGRQSFFFNVASPEFVNLDPEHVLVGVLNAENKTISQFAYQFKHAGNFIDRYTALDTCLKSSTNAASLEILSLSLKDKNPKIRTHCIEGLKADMPGFTEKLLPVIEHMAANDADNLCRAAAISALAKTSNVRYETLYRKGLLSQSLAIDGASLMGLASIDKPAALVEAEKLKDENSTKILEAVGSLFFKGGTDEHARFYERVFSLGPDKFGAVFNNYLYFLVESKNTSTVKKGISLIRNRIESLHNKDYSASLQQAYENIAMAKRNLASQTLIKIDKDAYIVQSEAFASAAADIKAKQTE